MEHLRQCPVSGVVGGVVAVEDIIDGEQPCNLFNEILSAEHQASSFLLKYFLLCSVHCDPPYIDTRGYKRRFFN